MITVSILINGQAIYTRTAVNQEKKRVGISDKANRYLLDDGQVIYHKPDDGAIVLAKKMLDTITEVK